MTFFQNEFCTIEIEQANSTANVIWTSKTADMSEEAFKEQQLAQAEATKKHQLKGFFIDGRSQQFVITPVLQEWIVENAIKPSVASGLQKTAILLPEEIFAQVSIEQTMTEGSDRSFKVQYFDKEKDARAWLKS